MVGMAVRCGFRGRTTGSWHDSSEQIHVFVVAVPKGRAATVRVSTPVAALGRAMDVFGYGLVGAECLAVDESASRSHG